MEGNGRPSVGQVILLATSSTVTAILYMIYRRKSALVSGLKDAKKLSIDGDLKKVLMETPGKCVSYAVIEGVVKSVKEMLNSQFLDNCKGVIQRLTLQEHKMIWNRTTHLWSDHEKIIHQRTNVVPFDLVSDDDVNVFVRVVKPLDVAELDLEVVYERYHPAVQSIANVISHYISGEQPKGIKETEEMLKVGALVTGVGELVLDNNIIKLQPPKQGMAYYLSKLDFESLLEKQESVMKRWKVLTVVFSAVTFITIFFILRRQYKFYKEKQVLRKMQEEIRERNAHLFQGVEGQERETALNTCGICFTNSRSCVFLECGHVCSCDDCYHALPLPKKCPLCRMYISRVVPLYNS